MNDEAKQQILERASEIMNYVATGIEKGGSFAVEQAPLVAQEIIWWGIASGLLWMAFSAMCIAAIYWGIKKVIALDITDEPHGFFMCFFGGIGAMILAAVFANNVFQVAKASVAPRLYILEQLKGLL